MNSTVSDHLRAYGGSGPPLVLVGEILGGGASWSGHAERLSSRWQVSVVTPLVVIEAAEGRLPSADWGIPEEGRALASSLDSAGIEKAHLAGWSMGATIVLDFAMAHPERVLSLTLVEPQVWWLLRAQAKLVDVMRTHVERFRAFTQIPITVGVLAEFLRMVGALSPDENPVESRAWRLAWVNRLAITSAWKVVTHDDDPARLGSLDMPVLLVRGADTGVVDQAMTESLAELLPHAETLVLPGGHTSHLRGMDQFLDVFEGFLRG